MWNHRLNPHLPSFFLLTSHWFSGSKEELSSPRSGRGSSPSVGFLWDGRTMVAMGVTFGFIITNIITWVWMCWYKSYGLLCVTIVTISIFKPIVTIMFVKLWVYYVLEGFFRFYASRCRFYVLDDVMDFMGLKPPKWSFQPTDNGGCMGFSGI